jgi:hypothetical protein
MKYSAVYKVAVRRERFDRRSMLVARCEEAPKACSLSQVPAITLWITSAYLATILPKLQSDTHQRSD